MIFQSWRHSSYFVIPVLTLAIYARGLGRFFVSDDFKLLEWSLSLSWAQIFFGHELLYRPLILALFRLQFTFFGWNTLGWNLVHLAFHAINAILLWHLILRLTRHPPMAYAGALFFSLHYIHTEPVLWLAALTTLAMTTGVLAAAVVTSRDQNTIWAFVAVGIATFFSLMAKETAVILPPLLATIVWMSSASTRWRDYAAAITSGLVVALYLGVRLVTSSLGEVASDGMANDPYGLALGVNVVKNLLFLAISPVFPLDFRGLLDLWNQSQGDIGGLLGGLLSYPGTVLAVITVPIGYAIWWRYGDRTTRAGLLWMALSAAPVLLLKGSGERFVYLPSVGFCIAAASSGVRIWSQVVGNRRLAAGIAVAVISLGHLAATQAGITRWQVASGICSRVSAELDRIVPTLTHGSHIVILGLPDNFEGAWVWRNGLPSLGRLKYRDRDITLHRIEALKAPIADAIFLRFTGGRLLVVSEERTAQLHCWNDLSKAEL